MPERRMLAKSIIDTDAFSDMPVESQMLYIRLNLAADDDGFVANPRSIMRMYGFGDDSMKLLIAKKFVISFQRGDSFVFLIKHWKIHNYIQKDRYKASNFRELLRDVYLDENKAYSLTPGESKTPVLPKASEPVSGLDTDCIQPVSKMDTQVRLGKDRGSVGEERLDEDKKNNSYFFEEKEKEARIAHFVDLLKYAERYGYDPTGTYRLAQSEGISKSDIDEWRASHESVPV